VVNWFAKIPSWAALSLIMNGLLFGALLAVGQEHQAEALGHNSLASQAVGQSESPRRLSALNRQNSSAEAATEAAASKVTNAAITDTAMELPMPEGDRTLTYEDHVERLGEDAKAMALKNPQHLTVLLGDSLSLWFPGELMPGNRVWINQSISGEKTQGLSKRLDLIEDNKIETIFLMIGINDLIWGKSDQAILDNYQEIVWALKKDHPKTQIVVQSILPHGGENSTWESRDKLLALDGDRIVRVNNSLKKIAADNDAYYLDLYPIFVTGEGKLRPDLTTDGLHLNREGYLVWRSAISLYAQLELNNRASQNSAR
jgi:lysophospholipase L1-like esterase